MKRMLASIDIGAHSARLLIVEADRNGAYETIEDLDKGILESLSAAGCSVFDKIRYGIIPQLMPSFTSTLIYRFDMNLRDATVLGIVGAGGIGAPLIFAMNSYRWNDVGAILLGLVILVLIVEWCSSRLRTVLMRG